MSKYSHKANLEKLYFITTLTGFMKEVQKQIQIGYKYYFEHKFEYTKLENVLGRMDEEYHICESSNDRYHRQQENKVSVQILMFYSGGDIIDFILLARPGVNGCMNHNFFKTLKPKNAELATQRFNLNHYVLRRNNNQSYNFNKNEVNIEVAATIGGWTYALTPEYITSIRKDFLTYLKAKDTFHLNQIYASLAKLIPFKLVRKDYVKLRIFMAREITIRLKADKFFKTTMAGNFYNMAEKLPALKGIKIPTITVAEQIKPTILKKMTHPELAKKGITFHDE